VAQNQSAGNKGGLFRRLLRLVLNKSGKDYLTSMTGGDAYWDRMLAAQRRVQEQHAGDGRTGPAAGIQ
jgi:hypothetical protein